jgi:hypothetical protein
MSASFSRRRGENLGVIRDGEILGSGGRLLRSLP